MQGINEVFTRVFGCEVQTMEFAPSEDWTEVHSTAEQPHPLDGEVNGEALILSCGLFSVV